MAAWFEPQMGGFAVRADCVAQIVTDINSYIATDADGQTSFNIQQFMALAATRLAAIPDPSPPFVYNAPELLRSVNVRPMADKLLADLAKIATDNVGSTDLTTLLLDLEAKAAAVTKYYDATYSERAADLVIASLSSGPIDKNMPEAEDTTKETRYYRTTWRDDWGVESAPSEVSAAVEVGKKDTVTVTVGTVPSGRDITHWRGYRSNSGNEAAAFQYVPYPTDDNGVPIASTTVTDNVANSALQEVCPTTIWNEPPSNLQGLIGLANGIHLGFFGNTLCPSETGIPYAYPQDYRLTVEWPIVGLASWDQGAFCLTRGQPYFVSGVDAASLTARKIDAEQACVSARSICSTSRGVVYASPDGLCLATPGGVEVITAAHFTREEWQALGPETMLVQEHDGAVHIFPVSSGASYTAEVLADGAIAAWHFDESAGSFIDYSGNGRDATAVGTISYSQPPVFPGGETGSISVAGAGSAEIADPYGTAYNNHLSVEVAFSIPTTGLGTQLVGRGRDPAALTWSVFLEALADGSLVFSIVAGGGLRTAASAPGLLVGGQPYLATAAWTRGSKMELMVNGVLVGSLNVTATTLRDSTTKVLMTGRASSDTAFATATFGESSWYNTPLSLERHQAHYNALIGGATGETAYALDQSGKLVTTEPGYVSALYRDLMTDKLFTAAGNDVSARFTSATARLEGTWKRRIVLSRPANFGWLAVESDFLDKDGATARSVVVTVYNAAGTVLSTSTVSSRTPVRLPQMRESEVIVGVVSKAIVTRVTLASSADELKAL